MICDRDLEMLVIMSLLDKAECLKKVRPAIGGIFFATSGKEDGVIREICEVIGDGVYRVSGVDGAFGKYGSPLHGKMVVVFVSRTHLNDPADVFGKIFTKKCMNVSSMMAAVSADLRRGWLEMQQQAEGKIATRSTVEVSELLQGMKDAGLLPERFTPAGLAGIPGAQSSLAVARMEVLQWWMVEQGKDFGIIDVVGKDGTAYLDGSYPKLSGKKTMVIATQPTSQPSQVTFRAVTNIDVLAILGFDINAYNISVSTHQSIAQMLAHCVPVPMAFAAVMSAASVGTGQ